MKKYNCATAGKPLLPEDIRPLSVLIRTLDYLVTHIMDSKDHALSYIERFVSDRLRSIRADLRVQSISDIHAVTHIYETSVRWHSMMMYELAGTPVDTFNPVQNNENLSQAFSSLRQMYSDNNRLMHCHEAEMSSYYLLYNLRNSFLLIFHEQPLAQQKLPDVQFALHVYRSISERNYLSFFRLLRSATYLQACLMHEHVPRMRTLALKVCSFSRWYSFVFFFVFIIYVYIFSVD